MVQSTYTPRWIPVEELTQPQPKEAHAYWLTKRGERTMPSRKDIEPTEIPKLLAYIAIVEVLHEEPMDYFFRVEGEAVQTAIGFRRMGRKLSELVDQLGSVYPRARTRLDACRDGAEPLAYTSRLTGLNRSFYAIESLLAPLSNDGQRVDQILICMGFLTRP